jgi:hypothetical protein
LVVKLLFCEVIAGEGAPIMGMDKEGGGLRLGGGPRIGAELEGGGRAGAALEKSGTGADEVKGGEIGISLAGPPTPTPAVIQAGRVAPRPLPAILFIYI